MACRGLNELPSTPGTKSVSWTPSRRLGARTSSSPAFSTDVCLTFPAIAAIADGFQTYAVIDASGGFSQTQVDMGILRMTQAGVIPVCHSNVAVEILADNAVPEAEAVYGALGMPFSGLVFGLKQYFSRS